MGWETRKGKSYYYQKEREGARVRSVSIAATASRPFWGLWLDEWRTREEEEKHQLIRAERQRHAEVDAEIARVSGLINLLASATLVAEGYHSHKRQRRKRRDRGAGESQEAI